jgi:F-type H+-transporting ATPase subunit gamma
VANQRDIKNRIKSITNTKKITSTMEMVSTSKMKKMQTRLEMSKPYEEKINKIITNLITSGVAATHNPLFREVANPTRILILQITGNRGLCGSFNANIIDNTLKFKKDLIAQGKEVEIFNIGKKGQNYLNFINEKMYKTISNKEDKLTFDDVIEIGNELTNSFLNVEFHEVYISYMKVITSTSQKPNIIRLLPISAEEETIAGFASEMKREYIFEPNPDRIFSYILPLYLKVKLYTSFLESSYSEYFARRVAMKNATDASTDMIRNLTISYNRARQAKITNEIAEIVGGAAALE